MFFTNADAIHFVKVHGAQGGDVCDAEVVSRQKPTFGEMGIQVLHKTQNLFSAGFAPFGNRGHTIFKIA